jgi:hypothetical protein
MAAGITIGHVSQGSDIATVVLHLAGADFDY